MRLLLAALALLVTTTVSAQPLAPAPDAPVRTRDRGEGLPLSMFGTYISKGQLVVYPYYEYYRDGDFEYEAGELGFSGTDELRSRYRAHEGLIFLAYGLTDDVAIEFEAATITAALDKSPADVSALPARLEQSGIGDVEAQIRWRWNRESDTRPEIFSYFETVFPVQRKKLLIGTTGYEYTLGTGIIRGLRWGTITARVAVAHSEGAFEPGEFALEYLRRISPQLRFFAAVEGTQDELEAITEAQVFLRDNVVLKLNNAFGITPKAPGWAPEIGIAFRFGRR